MGAKTMKAIERTGVDYYCQVSDVNLLNKIVRELPDNPVCINIGAAYGTSALAMLEARPDSLVMSIDIVDCPEEQRMAAEGGFDQEDRYFFRRGRSQDIGKDYRYPVVDLVFVDGGHTYQDCYEDARIWYRVLKPNGIMAFHDYESEIQVLESVKRAVDDVTKVLNLQQIAREGTMIVFRKVIHEDI
jgi:predicted O-methyltransferase YrrM